MAVAPVVVEIQAEKPTAALTQTLLEACSRAVSETRCVLAGSEEEEQVGQPMAVAIVSWVRPRTVRIQVGLRDDKRWRTRELVFVAADEETEVWRAVGFATGTLVVRAAGEEPPPQVEQPAEEPEQPPLPPKEPVRPALEPLPVPAVTSRPLPPSNWISVDWVLLAGQGFRVGPWRLGGLVRVAYVLPSGFRLLASAEQAFCQQQGVDASWTTLGLGAGHGLALGRLGFGIRAEGVVERLGVSAAELPSDLSEAPESGRGERWLPGARAGLDTSWMLGESLGMLAGGNISWFGGTTEVRVRGEKVADAEPFTYGVTGGIRIVLR